MTEQHPLVSKCFVTLGKEPISYDYTTLIKLKQVLDMAAGLYYAPQIWSLMDDTDEIAYR